MKLKQLKKKTFTWIKSHQLESTLILAIILLASFVRLYKIHQFVIFLGDEGRDALVVKHILVDHKLTLLGPTASVGGFYIGPLYYYMIAPFLLLSNFDPVGPAIMIALMGISTVALLYWIVRKWFGPFSATLTAFIYSISPGVVAFSRSSWNPNPMPLFSLIAVISAHFAAVKKSLKLALLSGIFYGACFQLHYLGLLVGPIIAAVTLINSNLKDVKNWFKLGLVEFAGFFIGASLYFAFELRHGFPNIRSVIEFIDRGGDTTGIRNANIAWLFYEINRFNLEGIFGRDLVWITKPVTLILLFMLIGLIIYFFKNKTFKPKHKTVFAYLFTAALGLGMYRGGFHYHYFQHMFLAPFLVFAAFLGILKHKLAKLTAVIITISLSVVLVPKLPIWSAGSNLINQTQSISQQVAQLTDNQPFNFALIADGNSDHAYRYFLEIMDYTPTPLEDQVTSQLLIVCEKAQADCNTLGHPIWEIAGFGRAEIELVEETPYPNIYIFKLIHHPDSMDLIGKPAPKG